MSNDGSCLEGEAGNGELMMLLLLLSRDSLNAEISEKAIEDFLEFLRELFPVLLRSS